MKIKVIEVFQGINLVKTFTLQQNSYTINNSTFAGWDYKCRTNGTDLITEGVIIGSTIMNPAESKPIGNFTRSTDEIEAGTEFKVMFINSKDGMPGKLLTLDCKCTEVADTATFKPESERQEKSKVKTPGY